MKLGTVADSDGKIIEGKLMFFCPGCGYEHFVNTNRNGHVFNGDFDKPTFTPSVLVHGQHRCHSFITEGKIKYLNDCSHQLAGQTITLPEVHDA